MAGRGKERDMFISRRKFEEAIAKAVSERENQIYMGQRLIGIEDDFYRRTNELDRRISMLETKVFPVEDDSKCEKICPQEVAHE